MTSYDKVFTEFMTINKTDPINIPSQDEKKYEMIQSALNHYNNRMRTELIGDDTMELLNKDLSGDELILLAHFLKLSFLENILTEFVTVFSTFQKEVGIANYQSQLRGKEDIVDRELNTIEQIILNQMDDYM